MPHAGRAEPAATALHAGLLCLTAGFVDAVGYFELGQVFTANMTGNTVLFAASLVRLEWSGALTYVIAVAAFFGGALIAAVLDRTPARPYPGLLLIALALSTASFATLEVRAELALLSAAMGVQGGSLSRFSGVRLQTVVLTGGLVGVADGLVERFWKRRAADAVSAQAFGLLCLAWLCYAAGAAGAVLSEDLLTRQLLVPAGLVVVAALTLAWRDPRGRRHSSP
jgi:uncharacterized membrane protein YoaK (UPF0700 family)